MLSAKSGAINSAGFSLYQPAPFLLTTHMPSGMYRSPMGTVVSTLTKPVNLTSLSVAPELYEALRAVAGCCTINCISYSCLCLCTIVWFNPNAALLIYNFIVLDVLPK